MRQVHDEGMKPRNDAPDIPSNLTLNAAKVRQIGRMQGGIICSKATLL